jgi:hypothetical protein
VRFPVSPLVSYWISGKTLGRGLTEAVAIGASMACILTGKTIYINLVLVRSGGKAGGWLNARGSPRVATMAGEEKLEPTHLRVE